MKNTITALIHNIATPLDAMAKAVERMADGHLDQMVQAPTGDEISKLSESINDLAINLQEILLHVWSHTEHSMTLINNITESIHSQSENRVSPEVREELEALRKGMEDMQTMVKAFEFYHIEIDKGKIVANENNGMGEERRMS
ncbi:MAG: HAMP domain-containing protein [Desulfobulbaceae bacterium]|nr:HAMP domain-containing protein [Desulfobulbaceae bacterium]